MTYFCTLENVRAALDMHSEYTQQNPMIASAIEQASTMIRAYTRREWDFQQYTDFADTSDIDVCIGRGKGVYKIFLTEKPVSILPGKAPLLRYSPSGLWDDTTDLPANLYQVDQRKNQIVMYPAQMAYRPRSIRITYWAGYQTQPEVNPAATNADPECLAVPDNIKYACVSQASYLVKRMMNDTNGTNRKDSQERIASYGPGNAAGLTKEALALLRTEVRLFMGG